MGGMMRNGMKALLAVSLLLLAVLVHPAASQTIRFIRQYGGDGNDWGYAVRQTTDNGYIIAGRTTSFGPDDIYLIKTDPRGDTLWTKTYGGPDFDAAFDVLPVSDGGYLIAGMRDYNADAYLVRTDSLGDSLWTRRYRCLTYNYLWALSVTGDGGFIATGTTVNGGCYIYLIRINADGDTLWTKAVGNGGCHGRSVQQTADGGFIIAGYTTWNPVSDEDLYLVKTDSLGDTLWTKTIGGSNVDEGYSVQQTADGGYIVCGMTRSFGAGWYDAWLIKTDASGDTIWTKTYGGPSTEYCLPGAEPTADGGYIIGATTASYGQGNMHDFYLIKTNAAGNAVWTKVYGEAGWDLSSDVHQTADHGFIMVGNTSASMGSGPYNVYLVKTDSTGIATGVAGAPVTRSPAAGPMLKASPNPFKTAVRIDFALPQSGPVKVAIYNALGEKVKILTDQRHQSGRRSIFWDGKDEQGRRCAAGGYICRLQNGANSATKNLVLLR